jgi:hypothetical protein
MKEPSQVSCSLQEALWKAGLWNVNPLNLQRIMWRNQPVASGGLFGEVNYLQIPRELTRVQARMFALVGNGFPRERTRWAPPMTESNVKEIFDKCLELSRDRGDDILIFENHAIRGLKKMQTRCALALTVMLALACGRRMEKQVHLMRSPVRSAWRQRKRIAAAILGSTLPVDPFSRPKHF